MALQVTKYSVEHSKSMSFNDTRTVLFVSSFDIHSMHITELTGTIEEIAKYMIGVWAFGEDGDYEYDEVQQLQIDEYYNELAEEYEAWEILDGVIDMINGDGVYQLIYKN